MEKVVTMLMKGGVAPGRIGFITPNEGQRAHVVATMLRVPPPPSPHSQIPFAHHLIYGLPKTSIHLTFE